MRVSLTKTPVWVKFSTTGEMQWEEGSPESQAPWKKQERVGRERERSLTPLLPYNQTVGDFQK